MNRNKHLLLWSSAGVLLLLIVAMVQENFLRQWRRIQGEARAETGPIDVRLRQVVVPALHVTDRCVSCHVGMAPGESGISGGKMAAAHPNVGHEPSEFGCTVCHGGQGRATEKDDAHGASEFWPEPMLPLRHSYAGCGSCHTHLQVQDRAAMVQGSALLERFDCLSCHSLDGRGGTLRPGAMAGVQAPDLSRIGAKGFDKQWLEKHQAKSAQAATAPWKGAIATIAPAQRASLEAYLETRVGAPLLVEAKAVFHSLGCRGCHKVGGVGGDDGPDLTLVGQRDPHRLNYTQINGEHSLANWLAEHFRNPARVVPGSTMPNMGLTEKQVDALTFYMLSLRRSAFPEAYWPRDRVRAQRLAEREFATDGQTLYGTFCAACHGERGEGRHFPGMTPFPAIANADFLAVASDEFIAASVTRGRTGRRMPAWGEKEGGLRGEEIANVVKYLRELGGVKAAEPDDKPRRWANGDVKRGQQLFTQYCAGCHGATGQGVEAPALNNSGLLSAASDTYLVQTIARGRRNTLMPGFSQASPVHPALSPAEIESIVSFLRTWEKP